jgi:translation elongation factor EF-1beta
MDELEANVRAIEKDGLVWGASKRVALAFGIKKLQINLVVEDEKVSLDELQQQIEEDEDHVQSTDIVRSSHPSIVESVALTLNHRLLCKSCRSNISSSFVCYTRMNHGLL